VVLLATQSKIAAQNFPPKFHQLTQEQGLSNNAATFIYQDKSGLIWIGTRYGLTRYDGYEVQVYSKEGKGRFFIPLDDIYNICEDESGRLLIIPFNGEVLALNKITQAFEPYFTAEEKKRMGLKDVVIIDLCTDKSGTLWLSTLGHGLISFNQKLRTGRIYNTTSQPAILNNKVNSLFNDSQNRLWVATASGLTVISSDRKSTTDHRFLKISGSNQSNFINTMVEDRLNQLWIGTEHGLFLYQGSTGMFETFESLTKQKIPQTIVRSLQDDADGNMWIGTDDGLYIYDVQKQIVRNVPVNPKERLALNDKYVFSLCRDKQDNMWLGTYFGGVNIHYHSNYGFGNFAQEEAHNALEGKIVRDIVEDKKGNLWFGLENSGIVGLIGKDRKVQRIKENSLQAAQVQGLDCDEDGNLWIGNYNKGLDFFDLKTNKIQHFSHQSDDSTSLSTDAVNNVLVDNKGRIWAGTNLGGLNRYDKGSKKFIQYRHSAKANSLSNDQVATMYEDQKGRIWVGTVKGLNLYNEQSDDFKQFDFNRGDEDGAAKSRYITAIFENKKGVIWVGTAGDGLFKLDANTGKSQAVANGAPLSNSTVYKILEDNGGQIWFSSNNGLYRLNPATSMYEKYTRSNGLTANQFNYNSGLLLNNGQLIFGAINGYTIFDPTQISKSDFKPTLIINDFRVGDLPAHSVNELKTNPLEKIRLAHDQSTLNLSFLALEYGSNDNKMYSYKLENYDNDWSIPSKNKTATYTQLPPGEYRFLVKATNNDSEWLAASNPITIKIRNPWWRTAWAYLFYALLMAYLVYIFRRNYTLRNDKKRALLLEQYERKREKELSTMKYHFFTNISHEFRTPLTLIKAPLEELKTRLIKGEGDAVGQKIQLMSQQVDKMMRLVDQLMDVSKSETGQLTVYKSAADIVALTGQVVQQFQTMAVQQKIVLTYEPSISTLLVEIDIDKIEKVVYNLLSNAFKYTPSGGQITINLECIKKEESSVIKIAVHDTGVGIPEADVPFIFDRFYQGNNQQSLAQKGTGIGLAHCKELIELHQGDISFTSEVGKGTTFEVNFPLVTPKAKAPSSEPTETEEVMAIEAVSNVAAITTPSEQPTILVVEDDPDVQTYLKELLEEKYKVICMDNGQLAWAHLQQELPDIVLSDVMMPLMDGIHFCKHIKSHLTTCHLPVVLLTAKTTIPDQVQGLETGADDYISKPFHPDVLQARIHNLLMSRRILKDKIRKELILQPVDVTTNSLDETFLKSVMAILEANIGNSDFSAQTLVQSLNMSRSSFYRKLQAISDLSPSDFIREMRMKRAAQLLENQELNVTEVAYAVGYNDLKTFRQNFQQRFNVTPSQYVKKK
jgi:signal transduction histidine kinase/ligand-binding sensor domain-containing protein/CheY-like chemotaxis protein/AraC-like DNA-binding protein